MSEVVFMGNNKNDRIEFRCKSHGCRRLLFIYYPAENHGSILARGIEMKCEKCKRVIRLKNYSQEEILKKSFEGVLMI